MLPCIPVAISPSIPTSAINLAPQFPSQSSFSTPLRSFTIAASLSLTASSPPNLNRSCITNPYGWKTHEEILIPASNPFQPFYPKALSLICHQILQRRLHGKLLVMEKVKVAPPKAMEMRATKGGRISEAPLSIGVESSTMYIQLRKRLRHQPVQKLLIRLIADSTTNEHYNFKLDVDM
ncbi:unnamed protein product [Malus baccata var. baccata]